MRIFESINHQHLVKHFGVEIHREEMLIFMEYCPEGTIEALIMSTEEGLDEVIVRRYTKQIVEAVACLHEHGVVHRDIKGANIFLTQEMKTIKLGDFGCAVKIKSQTTMPGELQGFVGTQAYMMVQGERPWADLKSNYQIMFKVVNTVDNKIRHTLNISGWNGPVTRSTRPSLSRREGLPRNLFCSSP